MAITVYSWVKQTEDTNVSFNSWVATVGADYRSLMVGKDISVANMKWALLEFFKKFHSIVGEEVLLSWPLINTKWTLLNPN